MHELSIAQSVVSTVTDALAAQLRAGYRVLRVQLRVGPLAGVVPDAMRFCWDIVTADSALAGARLEILRVPVAAACPSCGATSEHTGSPPLLCPACDAPCLPVGDGRTLEVGEVELDDDEDGGPAEGPSSTGVLAGRTGS